MQRKVAGGIIKVHLKWELKFHEYTLIIYRLLHRLVPRNEGATLLTIWG